MAYNPVQEIMSYFYFEFNIYVVLTVIVGVMALKGIWSYLEHRKSLAKARTAVGSDVWDVSIGFLAMVGMGNAMMFQGVLSDIPHEATKLWMTPSLNLFITASLFFLIQVICLILKRPREK